MLSEHSKIGAIRTFLRRLDELGKVDGTQLYFRGHSKSSYELKPSVYRNRGWIQNEATMFKELILRCPDDFAGGMSTFQCLVRMQHYGLPTRLLDVTSNPLVALHFACDRHKDDEEDGEVIVFGFSLDPVKYFDSDTVSVIANLSRRPADFSVPDVADIDAFNASDAIKLLLHDIRQDRPHFDPKILRSDLGRVICVKPRLENPRIIRQEGAFLLFGCAGVKAHPAEVDGQTVVARFTINQDAKKVLADQLETLGISRATMFPEIEQVATYIRDINYLPTLDLSRLTPAQKRVFEALQGGLTLSVRELASATNLRPSAVSRVLAEFNDRRIVQPEGSGRERRWRTAPDLEVRPILAAE